MRSAVIKNYHALASTGDVRVRGPVLAIAEAALVALDTYRVLHSMLTVDGDNLRIGSRSWPLGGSRRVFVLGAGKAGNAMARAVDEVLGDRIHAGLVSVKRLEAGDRLKHLDLIEGGHPLPDEASLQASRRILAMTDQVAPGDLVITLISGGSSALMCCPLPDITLSDERAVTESLLTSGARILEINAVRRHISAINGGRLAERIERRGAELINLIVSDSVGKKPVYDPSEPTEFVGTPVAPDGTTLADARAVIGRYGLTDRIPQSIARFLKDAGPEQETPKVFGANVHHFVLERPGNACEAARAAAEQMGVPALVLTTQLEGESRDAGTFLACIAKEVALNHRPIAQPAILIAGGETTTRVDSAAGRGGPSQELALSFALEVADRPGMSIVALDTDGTDGPTDVAGGVADGCTVERVRALGQNVHDVLCRHDSGSLLERLGDTIVTGNTGTNVCDLNLIYVAAQA